jgi:hypothetical protein
MFAAAILMALAEIFGRRSRRLASLTWLDALATRYAFLLSASAMTPACGYETISVLKMPFLRTRVVSIFPNDPACLRLISVISMEISLSGFLSTFVVKFITQTGRIS